MTEPIPFPTSPYCRVRARVASIWADGPDDGTHPDWRPAVGEKVVLTPSIGSQLLTYDVGGADPIIVTVERVDCVVGDDGLLAKSDGRPVYIAPTDDPLLSATGWTWTASIKGKSVTFSAPTGGVVDLALFVAAPATDSTKEWVERIPELITAGANAVDAADRAEAAANLTRETNIEIGTVTTGAAGSSASAVIVGEAPDFLLNLGIPKGDPGGWGFTGALNLDGPAPNANDYRTPGTYMGTSASLMAENNWPMNYFQGYLEVISTNSGAYVMQRATKLSPPYKSWLRSRIADGTWSAWEAFDITGSVLSPEIHAPGRPDIPATTPYTAAQLGAIPSGHKYISLDGPQGAWEWQKRGATWVCVEGDTGWSATASWPAGGPVSGTPGTGVTPDLDAAGGIWFRRINDRVHVRLLSLTGTGINIPVGYRPPAGPAYEIVPLVRSNSVTVTRAYIGSNMIYPSEGGASVEGGLYGTSASYLTGGAWPTSLTGTPA